MYSPRLTGTRLCRIGTGHSKKKQTVQVVHVQRDARSAQEIVTLRASPSSVQESAQEIPVVRNLETLGNCPLSCCGCGQAAQQRGFPSKTPPPGLISFLGPLPT